MTEIEKFDPYVLTERVKKTIQGEFVKLVPEEEWNRLINGEWIKFKQVDLPKILKAEFENKCKDVCKKVLDSDGWKHRWRDGRDIASRELEELFVRESGRIFASIFAGAMQSVVDSLRNQLQRF